MVLQAHEGLSGQEARDRLECDLRWQAAAGLDAGAGSFHPTALVGLRDRLRASARPRRLFDDTKTAAGKAGVMGARVRVPGSTPVYGSVAAQGTVTQLRSVTRNLLRALDRDYPPLAAKARAVLARDDDYAGPGKPSCDWDDPAAPGGAGRRVGPGLRCRSGRLGRRRAGGPGRGRGPSCWLWSPARTSMPGMKGCPAPSGGSLSVG
jgi:hypothetical protein